MKKNTIVFIILLLLFIFLAISISVNFPFIGKIDAFSNKLFSLNHYPTVTGVSLFFTNLTSSTNSILIVIALSLMCVLRKKWYDMSLILISSGLAISISSAIKILFERARPIQTLVSENTMSFPSNHSVISAVFLCFFFYLITKNVVNKYLKYSSLALVFVIFIFIPLSRIILGAHYTTDVIAGFIIGLTVYIFTRMILTVLSYDTSDCDVCLKEKNVL